MEILDKTLRVKTSVGNRTNVIVINGKRYDARTGKLLQETTDHTQTKSKPRAPAAPSGVVDGFKKPNRSRKQVHAHTVHGKQTRSQTLMRHSVKKPSQSKHIPPQTSPAASPVQKKQHPFVNAVRMQRSADFQKSHLVSKFNPKDFTPVKQSLEHVPVAEAPPAQAPPADAPRHLQSRKHDFEAALANANSHQEKPLPKRKLLHKLTDKLRISPKLASAGSAALAIVLLGGFFVYQNIPTLAMRVAATRSGVNAHLPEYQPAGFAMSGPIQYSPGQISISFRSNTDNREYKLTQRTSSWNSETLLESFVATNRRQYQTFQDKGKTIYIYDGSNATWVDRGIWYNIEGKSALNSDQLIRLANSL